MSSAMDVAEDIGEQSHVEIMLSGFGGQGIVKSAEILGRAATVEEDWNAVMTQSYGPESRGGACMAGLVIDDGEIGHPRAANPDVIVVLSSEAYEKYGRDRAEDVVLIAEEDMVDLDEADADDPMVISIPATRIAEDLGNRIVANVVMLGFLTGMIEPLPPDAVKRAVLDSVPSDYVDLNEEAFEVGIEYASDEQPGAR